MDGIHDLGGKEGYGAIDLSESDSPFHEPWEGRMWGISRIADRPDWTIDWWRHVRELIDPVGYLDRPYFDSWAQTFFACYINSGVISLEEAASGKSAGVADKNAKVLDFDSAVEMVKEQAMRFDRKTDIPAKFKVGDTVIMSPSSHPHHTRLPQYVRSKTGRIFSHHGAHVFPDLSAQGQEIPQHLYTVVFDAKNLWTEVTNEKDKVYLDLWESYFGQA